MVDTQKDTYHPTVYLATQYYNNAAKRAARTSCRTDCGRPLPHLEFAGGEGRLQAVRRAEKTWMRSISSNRCRRSRDAGMRTFTRIGPQCTTTGPNDGNNLFNHFLIANGGNGILTQDGKVHLDDPQVKEAAIKATCISPRPARTATSRRGAELNDADDNNAFTETVRHGFRRHDLDRSRDQGPRSARGHDHGLPLGNDGKPMPAQLGTAAGVIPKGAKTSLSPRIS